MNIKDSWKQVFTEFRQRRRVEKEVWNAALQAAEDAVCKHLYDVEGTHFGAHREIRKLRK